jgi:hypothetical protein
LNVSLSSNTPSPAYSIRISVGDRTWNRALPSTTVAGAADAAEGRPTRLTAERLRASDTGSSRRPRGVRWRANDMGQALSGRGTSVTGSYLTV